MEGDPQLFGSMPGPTERLSLMVLMPEDDRWGTIICAAKCENRRDEMVLSVRNLRVDQMHTTLGFFIPLVVKGCYVGTGTLRRHFWAVHNALGMAGKEVSLKGAGKPRKSLTP